jgi:ABC-type nitrate/sulfonate/bicarbonate transport system substrate-binding protein
MPEPTITIALDWKANTNHTGLLVALHRGFFSDAGVAITVLPATQDRHIADMVARGEADLAYAFPGTVLDARAAGVPLISVAAVTPRNPSSIVALRRSGITRPADFAGKRYASFGHPALERAILRRMMAFDGAVGGDITLEPVRFAAVDLLERGEFDLLWIYDAAEGVEAAAQGIDLIAFHPQDFGVPEYEAPIIFAHEAALSDADRRDALTRALGALSRGYALAARDPSGVLEDIHAVAPQIGGWLFGDDEITLASQCMQSQLYLAHPGAGWGRHTPTFWQDFPRFLREHGALAVDLPAGHLFTNDLITTSEQP